MISLNKLGICLAAVLMLFGNTAIAADAPAKNKLIFYTSGTAAPKSFSKDDKVTGFVVDITVEAARRAGYMPEVQAVPWARAVQEAEQGTGLITIFSRTPEREKIFNFTEPVFQDPVVFITRKDSNITFNGLKDLAGKTIGMSRGSIYGPAFAEAVSTFKRDDDSAVEQRFQKLAAGRVDGIIITSGRPGFLHHVKALGMDPQQFVVHKTPVVLDPNYIAAAKTYPNSAEIISRLNKALASMSSDGTIAKIMASYE